MQYKVAELDGALLDAAVAKARGFGGEIDTEGRFVADNGEFYCPSTDWADAGGTIERERIQLVVMEVEQWDGDDLLEPKTMWCAYHLGPDGPGGHYFDTYPDQADAHGATPLIAAMRAYVARKFGKTVELPGPQPVAAVDVTSPDYWRNRGDGAPPTATIVSTARVYQCAAGHRTVREPMDRLRDCPVCGLPVTAMPRTS